MRLKDLRTGEPFKFTPAQTFSYIARGNGWYSSRGGYDGGPWYTDPETEVHSPQHDLSNQWESHLASRTEGNQ